MPHVTVPMSSAKAGGVSRLAEAVSGIVGARPIFFAVPGVGAIDGKNNPVRERTVSEGVDYRKGGKLTDPAGLGVDAWTSTSAADRLQYANTGAGMGSGAVSAFVLARFTSTNSVGYPRLLANQLYVSTGYINLTYSTTTGTINLDVYASTSAMTSAHTYASATLFNGALRLYGYRWDGTTTPANSTVSVDGSALTYNSSSSAAGSGTIDRGPAEFAIASIGYGGTHIDRSPSGTVYAAGVFTGAEVTPKQFGAINAYLRDNLRTLSPPARRVWARGTAAGGGAVTVTTSASGRFRGRASSAVAPTKTASCAARERVVGAASTQPIKVVAVVGREGARGSNATTPISIVSAVGRCRARGSTSASQVAPDVVVTSAVGRERVRGSNTATSIRTVAVVGRRRARGAGAASSIRAQLAAGRVRARGATTAAPIVAGTVVTSTVGRLRARSSSSCTTTRVTALAGRVRARGSDAVSGFRVVAVSGRRRARGAASAGPAGVLVDSTAASRLWVRGTTAAVAMPPLVLVPGRVCIGARQPASVAINASILACDCNY